MLITEMKSKETLASLISGKVFIINCHGCKEVRFPEKEAGEFQKELAAEGKVTGSLTTDYICNPENMKLRLEKHMDEIKKCLQHATLIHYQDSRVLHHLNMIVNSVVNVT